MYQDAPTRLPRRAARWLALASLAAVTAACSDKDPSGPNNNDGGECDVNSPTGTVTVGQTINGSLGGSDCKAPDGTFADIYRITVAAPTHVSIMLSSNAFDAYLVILDADGEVIGEDDDSAGGSNAGISGTLNAGTYYIGANTVNPGETGAYQLIVDE